MGQLVGRYAPVCAPQYGSFGSYGSFDFVYIDARHDYASALEDIRDWWPKVRRGGILAGHDYVDAMVGLYKLNPVVDL
jgi:predicted O-methyltransferase YrrM